MTEFPFLHLTVAGVIGFVSVVVGYMSAGVRNLLVFPFNVVTFSILITCTTMSRLLLPLCPQPRLAIPDAAAWGVGLTLFGTGALIIILAVWQIGLPAAASAPNRQRRLVTNGIYRRLRHPIYLGEILWPIGWAILFKALWALAVTPVWIALLLTIALLEEKRLSEEYAEKHEEYKKHVPFLLPGVFKSW
ncbi:MAG: isoprenylcysteine carboxylmethyltransferase family protein [Candidatus Brocadiales bacterium]|nr:isoprenylcysteine carboxylmethyltransferase family protein [Candidatus Bathyanammoxibius sp.]